MTPTEPDNLDAGERAARGRAARAAVPRSSHAAWQPSPSRADPVAVQEEQALTRVPELVPIRNSRMLASPFAFFRGTAESMAADLAGTPASRFEVQLCGDAHLSNFGAFGSPDRELVFDINDFDETIRGPWEWDVKRLAASIAVAGRDRGFGTGTRRTMLLAAGQAYREAMRDFAQMGNLAVWYARAAAADVLRRARADLGGKGARNVKAKASKARSKDSLRALARLTEVVDGTLRIVSQPPLIIRVTDLVSNGVADRLGQEMRELLRAYGQTLPPDRRHLLEGYRYVDMARKVVGVGSVGTRVWIVLLAGRDDADPLFLQCKEAGPSALEPFTTQKGPGHHGQRVVEGQRLMQAASDILLGWVQSPGLADGVARDYYVRQLWDWKQSAAVEEMTAETMKAYGRLCAWTLARAHARSGDRIAIAAYLGKGRRFDGAIADFAEVYADQNQRDYEALATAADEGRIPTHA